MPLQFLKLCRFYVCIINWICNKLKAVQWFAKRSTFWSKRAPLGIHKTSNWTAQNKQSENKDVSSFIHQNIFFFGWNSFIHRAMCFYLAFFRTFLRLASPFCLTIIRKSFKNRKIECLCGLRTNSRQESDVCFFTKSILMRWNFLRWKKIN